jgi:hypothetical protein
VHNLSFTSVLLKLPYTESIAFMTGAGTMLSDDWESMTIDELFELRELMQDVLSERLKARKAELEQRLRTVIQRSSDVEPTKSHSPAGT